MASLHSYCALFVAVPLLLNVTTVFSPGLLSMRVLVVLLYSCFTASVFLLNFFAASSILLSILNISLWSQPSRSRVRFYSLSVNLLLTFFISSSINLCIYNKLALFITGTTCSVIDIFICRWPASKKCPRLQRWPVRGGGHFFDAGYLQINILINETKLCLKKLKVYHENSYY